MWSSRAPRSMAHRWIGAHSHSWACSPTRSSTVRPDGLEAQCLRDAPDLGLATGLERIHGADTEAVLGREQPVHGFVVAESAIAKHDERALELAHRFVADDEIRRYAPHAVQPRGEKRAVLDEATNLADLEPEQLREVRNRQPLHIR